MPWTPLTNQTACLLPGCPPPLDDGHLGIATGSKCRTPLALLRIDAGDTGTASNPLFRRNRLARCGPPPRFGVERGSVHWVSSERHRERSPHGPDRNRPGHGAPARRWGADPSVSLARLRSALSGSQNGSQLRRLRRLRHPLEWTDSRSAKPARRTPKRLVMRRSGVQIPRRLRLFASRLIAVGPFQGPLGSQTCRYSVRADTQQQPHVAIRRHMRVRGQRNRDPRVPSTSTTTRAGTP